VKRVLLAVALVIVAVLGIAASVGAVVSPTVSVKTTPASLGTKGGRISFKATIHNAKTCVFSSTPKVSKFNGEEKCSNGTYTKQLSLGKNTGKTRTIHLQVTVKGIKEAIVGKSTVTQTGELASSSTPIPTTPTTASPPGNVATTTTATPVETTIPSSIAAGLPCTTICIFAVGGGNVYLSWPATSGIQNYVLQFYFNGLTANFSNDVGPTYTPPILVDIQTNQNYVEYNPANMKLCSNETFTCGIGTMMSFAYATVTTVGTASFLSAMSNTITIN
jgi:hypothetical protein